MNSREISVEGRDGCSKAATTSDPSSGVVGNDFIVLINDENARGCFLVDSSMEALSKSGGAVGGIGLPDRRCERAKRWHKKRDTAVRAIR